MARSEQRPTADYAGGVSTESRTDDAPGEAGDERKGLPAQILVEALSRERRARSLDAESFPDWLMAEPITLSLEWLARHSSQCRSPMRCEHTPGALRPLLKMRRSAREKLSRTVFATLWTHPDSTMVREVCASVRNRHEELIASITSGEFFDDAALERHLEDLNGRDAQTLTAALWAAQTDDPRAAELLMLLPALTSIPSTPREPDTSSRQATSTSVEKARHREHRLQLQERVAELEQQLEKAQGAVRDRAEELARTTRDQTSERRRNEELATRVEALELSLNRAGQDARAAAAMAAETGRDLRQARTVSDRLGSQLTRTESELALSEAERGTVVRALAAARAQIQAAEAELRAIPRGKQAIADWLASEEARLNDMEHTLEGGARGRVLDEKRLRRKLEQAFHEAYPEFIAPPPRTVGEVRPLQFTARGGGDEVGRSCYELRIGSHTLLVDCGIAVGRQQPEEQVPDLGGLEKIDALLVTHAHTDHIGWIPAAVAKIERRFPIYCTGPTAELLPVMLKDSRLHYERQMARQQQKREWDPTAAPLHAAYERADISETESRLNEIRMDEPRGIGSTDLQATFFPAGHILGAASILVEGGGRRVLFSGDISAEHQHTVGGFRIPHKASGVDLLVLESTYGDRCRPAGSAAEDELIDFVGRTVTHGVALLPCFALGRAQEVLAILLSARRAGRLPAGLRILADGMINKINPIYVGEAKLDPAGFTAVGGSLDRELAIAQALGRAEMPTVVVTTSGMLTGGPVIEWARRLLPDSRHRMALLGYQDEGSPGGLLRRLERERPPHTVKLYNDEGVPSEITVRSNITSIGLSAHADQAGLLEYARAVRPTRIALVHGDAAARTALRDVLLRENVCDEVLLGSAIHCP
jgi:Cft2 family RNA processing exonuclease